jgi:hypothetical protein
MVNRLAVKFIAILFVPPQPLLPSPPPTDPAGQRPDRLAGMTTLVTNCAGGWGAT